MIQNAALRLFVSLAPKGAWIVFTSLFLSASAFAQEGGSQSIEQAANDPTASLMSFQLQNFYSPNLHNQSGSGNVLQFRSAIPFQHGGYDNIARVTVPYVTKSRSGQEGLSDITVFNLVAFDRPWGRFGVGAVGLLPTGDRGLGAGKRALGPAFGFAARSDKLLWGVFNQNLVTVDERFDGRDVNISTIQPLYTVSLGDGWSTGVSEMTLVYDWNANKFKSLPLGIKISKLTRMGKVPIQFQATCARFL